MRKVIFLDIDGVVNTYYYDSFGNARYNQAYEKKLNNWQAVCFFNELYKHHEYDIVITSTWKRLLNLDDLRQCFYESGFNKEIKILGTTLIDNGKNYQRYFEILHFINFKAKKYPNNNFLDYIIIDDELVVKNEHMVLCSYFGFNLKEFLETKNYWHKINEKQNIKRRI